MRKFLSVLAAILLSTTAAWAQYTPGPSAGPPPINKLTTADVFSDFRVSGLISSVSGPVGVLHHPTGVDSPSDIAMSTAGTHLFVVGTDSLFANGQVAMVLMSDYSTVHTQTLPGATAVTNSAVSSDGFVYVIGQVGSDATCWKLSATDLSIDSTVTVSAVNVHSGQSGEIALSSDNAFLYWASYDGHIVRIDTAAMSATSNVISETTEYYTTVSPKDATHVWAIDDASGNVDVIATTTGAHTTAFTLSAFASGTTAMVRSGNKAVVGSFSSADVYVLDLSTTGSEVAKLSGSAEVFAAGLAINATHAYAADQGGTTVKQVPLDGSTSFSASFTASGIAGVAGCAVKSDDSAFFANDFDASPTNIYQSTTAAPTLSATIPSGVAYVGGSRVSASAVTAHVFTASKDTYDFLQADGTHLFSAVANGNPQPVNTGLLTQKVVTDGSGITSVVALAPVKPATGPQVIQVTGDYTVVPGGNQILIVTASVSDITITFPPAASAIGTNVQIYANYLNAHNVNVANALGEGVSNAFPRLLPNDLMTFVPYTGNPDGVSWLATSFLPRQLSNMQQGPGQWFGQLLLRGTDGALYIDPITAPGNPASGWAFYEDTADGHVKLKKSDGTVVDLTP